MRLPQRLAQGNRLACLQCTVTLPHTGTGLLLCQRQAFSCAGGHLSHFWAPRHGQGLLRDPCSRLCQSGEQSQSRKPPAGCPSLLLSSCSQLWVTMSELWAQAGDFAEVGVDHIWAVAIGDPEAVSGWAKKTKLSEGKV